MCFWGNKTVLWIGYMQDKYPLHTQHWQAGFVFFFTTSATWSPSGSERKESACNSGDPILIPGLGRSPGEGNGCPLQYFCLENSVDRSLEGYSPRGCKESDTTKRLTLGTPKIAGWLKRAGPEALGLLMASSSLYIELSAMERNLNLASMQMVLVLPL